MPEPAVRIETGAREPLTFLRTRGELGSAAQALGARLGLSWPTTPNTLAEGPPAVLWTSPNDWLIVGEAPSDVADSLPEVVHHLTDATHQLVALDLRGPLAPALISAGCSVDLHPRTFGPGRCAATQLAGVPILLRALPDVPDLRLYVDVSLAAWLRAWLEDAATGLRP